MSNVDEIKAFCLGYFDRQAAEVRHAVDCLQAHVLEEGGDIDDVKEIVAMGAARLRKVRLKLDDVENTGIAKILSRDRLPKVLLSLA